MQPGPSDDLIRVAERIDGVLAQVGAKTFGKPNPSLAGRGDVGREDAGRLVRCLAFVLATRDVTTSESFRNSCAEPDPYHSE